MQKVTHLFTRNYYLPKNIVLLLVFLLGLSITFITYDFVKAVITKRVVALFTADAQEEANLIQNEIENSGIVLYGLQAFFDSSSKVDAQQLEAISEKLLKNMPTFQALAWAPRSVIATATPQLEFPITYVVPHSNYQQFVGINLNVKSETRDAIAKALKQKAMTASAKIADNVMFFVPLIKNNSQMADGFIVGIYRIEDLLKRALSNVTHDSLNIRMTDLTADPHNNFLYALGAQTVPKVGCCTNLVFDYKVRVMDREWLLHFTSYNDYYKERVFLLWLIVVACLGVLVGVLLLIDRLYCAFEQTQRLAHIDGITNLPDRRYFDEVLKRELAKASRETRFLSLLYMDIDVFKNVNDTYGHHVGDLLLKEIAKTVKENLRRSDFVARLGGDEFAVILFNTRSHNEANVVARKIVHAFQKPFFIAKHKIKATLSIGIAHFPIDGTDEATLLKKADAAMYNVKRAGRNGYQNFISASSTTD